MRIKKGGVRRSSTKKLFESKFKKLGYVIMEEPKEEIKDEPKEDEEVNLDELSYRDLQGLAQDNDIQANQKKEELIKLLSEVI